MRLYIGTKVVLAAPMTRQRYNDYRGWTLPDDEDGSDEGYLVEYADGGQTNHPDHEGYISWSPAGVFDKSYTTADGAMSFSRALHAVKAGVRIARVGWNGKGMYLFYVENWACITETKDEDYPRLPFIAIKTADDHIVPWPASQTDILADDWCVVQ